MRARNLFAAVLGCVLLLTGCGNDTGERERSFSSSSSSSVFSKAESSEEYSSTTELSSSTSFSESSDKENEIPNPYIYRTFDFGGVTEIQWRTDDSDFMADEYYKMRVYLSPTIDDYGEVTEFAAYKTISYLTDRLFVGDNYFRIQLFTSKSESKISDPFCYTRMGSVETPTVTETPKVHQYTHTFDAPSGITVVPDYTLALSQINEGMLPSNFYAKIYYTCPLCGRKMEADSTLFTYSLDSSYTVLNVYCGNVRCSNSKSSWRAKINCYAVQIS